MAKNNTFLFHVKINESRKYPPGLYQAIAENYSEYTLKGSDGKTFPMFKVHCFRDRETMQADAARRQANATIGRK